MPIYPYKCEVCGHEFEEIRSVNGRGDVNHCGVQSRRLIPDRFGRPQITEYYSEQLGAMVTGAKQKAQLLKSKGLEELGTDKLEPAHTVSTNPVSVGQIKGTLEKMKRGTV